MVLNRDQLGGYATGVTSNTNTLQDILNGAGGGLWSTPAYWNGNVYMWANPDVPKLFQMNSGVLDTTLRANPRSFGVSGCLLFRLLEWHAGRHRLGRADGPVHHAWARCCMRGTRTTFRTCSMRAIPMPRGTGLDIDEFAIPMVTNGKVYLDAMGGGCVRAVQRATNAAHRSISPNGGTFGGPQNVTLSSTTASANIYYTLDGTEPTPASTLYTEPITINTDTTLSAIATGTGFVQSAVSSATFNLTAQTPPVSLHLPLGLCLSPASHLSDTDGTAQSTTQPMDRRRQRPRICIRIHCRCRNQRQSTRSPSTPACKTVMSATRPT